MTPTEPTEPTEPAVDDDLELEQPLDVDDATPAPAPVDDEPAGAATAGEAGRPAVDEAGRPVVDEGGRLVTFADTPALTPPAPAGVTVDTEARTIRGLVVPFGPAGHTSQGRFTFGAGSLAWAADLRRVKLLVEHDQRQPVGFATDLRETPAGIEATFTVPAGPAGDQALAEAAAGLRDGLSVGVALDERTQRARTRAQGAAVAAAGQLREVSLVSVPAFDDARVQSVAASSPNLVVSGWADATPTTGGPMPCQTCHHVHAAGVTDCLPEDLAAFASIVQTFGRPAEQLEQLEQPPAPPAAPAAPPLVTAGAALHVDSEPSTYTFDGTGPSLVVDAYNARMHADSDAHERLARYNAELVDGNPSSVLALAAVAVRTTDGPDSFIGPTTYRPDLLRESIDLGRPLFSRLNPIRLTNAQPFTLPKVGKFTGVGDHVEGTAHVAEGTLTGSDDTVTPKAVSGAYRLSRELIDASNPALDRVALREMVRDYRRHSEAKVAAALLAATPDATAYNVTTVMAVRELLEDFPGEDELPADFLVAGKTFRKTLLADVDGSGRPHLAYYGSTNAVGTVTRRAGQTSYDIDGAPLVRAGSLVATDAFAVEADAVLVGESPVQTFRFDEVEGPGVVKLALWAYVAAAVLDPDGVERYSSAADPTP